MTPPVLGKNHQREVDAVLGNRYHVWIRSPSKVLEVRQEAAFIGRYLKNESALSVLHRLKAKRTRVTFSVA